MSYSPISGDTLQYIESNVAASGYYIKFYASGTTTPISMATDSTGGTLLAKAEVNAQGRVINGSSAVFIPHIDQKYKFALYTNATDADADTLANAIYVLDTIPQFATIASGAETVKNFATLAAAVADTGLVDGDALNIAERTTGNDGAFVADVVLSSTVTEDSYSIIQCTGVPTLSLKMRAGTTVDIRQFGAVSGGSAATNTIPIKKAIEYAAANGVPRVVGTGTFNMDFSSYIGGDFTSLSNVNGLTIDFSAAQINDTTAYIEGQTLEFVSATDSTLVTVLMGHWNATVNAVIPSTEPRNIGARMLMCTNKCQNMLLKGKITGAYGGLVAYRIGTSDPLITKGSNFDCDIEVNGVHYPYNLQNNGDNSSANIKGSTVGRSHFVYGIDNCTIKDDTRNSLKQAYVAAFNGNETSNIKVYITDVNSDDGLSAARRCGIKFGDETPAKLTNLSFVFNIVSQSGGDFGHAFEIGKYNNAGTADTTQRGHELKGLSITGVLNTVATSKKPILQQGQLTGTDIVTGVSFEELDAQGGSSTTLVFDSYTGGIEAVNVNAGSGAFEIINNQGKLTAIGCVADRFTSATTDTVEHTYIDCSISNASGNQSTDSNKNFINTNVGAFKYSHIGSANSPDSTAIIVGDLSGTNNIFQVPAYSQISGTVIYSMIADQSVTSGSRAESFGKKSFSGTVNSSGGWTTHIGFTDEITQLDSASGAIPTFSLVDGTSAGAFIAVAVAGGYNGANSRAVIKLEAISWIPATIDAV